MRGIAFFILLFISYALYSQNSGGTWVNYIVEGGDTIYVSDIRPVYIFSKRKFKNERDYNRYQKIVRNVKKTLPYAKFAKKKYDQVELDLTAIKTDLERRKYLKQLEVDLKAEFEGELRQLTISQGQMLIKLIDREIGENSYVLLKEYGGSVTAVFWQTLARLFGSNLKTEFDPDGEDKLLNEIVILVEQGQL